VSEGSQIQKLPVACAKELHLHQWKSTGMVQQQVVSKASKVHERPQSIWGATAYFAWH